jgi:hypothetical protein
MSESGELESLNITFPEIPTYRGNYIVTGDLIHFANYEGEVYKLDMSSITTVKVIDLSTV